MVQEDTMDLFEVMRTAFSAREFTDEPVSDEVIAQILDEARFAPSGGNRQPWSVIVVRDRAVRRRFAQIARPTMQRYLAQTAAGESPYNTIVPSRVDEDRVAATELPEAVVAPLYAAPVLLVVGSDLRVTASLDSMLDRCGIAGGASIYPFVWNILLAAHARGLAGVITTYLSPGEPEVQQLLGLPQHVAVAAAIPLGHPTKRLTKLRRKPVSEFARLERFDGASLHVPD
jgi:nitroreductase